MFELADQLVGSDHNDDSLLDTRTEASGIALDELVASVDDGAMKAWRHLVDRIEQHPATAQIFEGMDVGPRTTRGVDIAARWDPRCHGRSELS